MAIKSVQVNAKSILKQQTKYQKGRRQSKLTLFTIGTTIFLLVSGVFLKGALADDDDDNVIVNQRTGLPYRPDRVGDGTEHEQAGIMHFNEVKYTPYEPMINYTTGSPKLKYGMSPIYSTTNGIIDFIASHDVFPEGYVEIHDDNNFYMGSRARNNEWRPLLSRYWVVWLIVAIFLVLIIAMPFFAVCYCCFCCHRRCGRYCPPCTEKADASRRCCYSILLFLLIIGLLLGVIIAFATNKLLEVGFAESTKNLGRSTDDTCRFMTNTVNHIKHLYINNYQELETQLVEFLESADNHIYLDIADVSGTSALVELTRFLENLPKALKVLIKLEEEEREARFFASITRDTLRGIKRYLNDIRHYWCGADICLNFHLHNDIQHMDVGCLHYDKVPNTTIFVESIEHMLKEDVLEIPLRAVEKLQSIGGDIKQLLDIIVPHIIAEIRAGNQILREQATIISSLVNKVISDIHLKTLRSSHSFDDIYSRLGTYRNLTNVLLCFTLLLIVSCLIVGLCYGSFGKRRTGYRDNCCNKGTGSKWLLIAIILIFLTYSIITLVGLFYFIFGLLAYHSACAPLRGSTQNIFVSFDALIDFQKVLPGKLAYTGEDNTDNPLPPIRLSYALNACRSNESIIDVLHLNKLYSMQNLKLLQIIQKIIDSATNPPNFSNKLEKLVLLSEVDMLKLKNMASGNLSSYRSSVYMENMCKTIPSVSTTKLANNLLEMKGQLGGTFGPVQDNGIYAYQNAHRYLLECISKMINPLRQHVEKVHDYAQQVDKLILKPGLTFDEALDQAMQNTLNAQAFIRKVGAHFITGVAKNLTRHIIHEVERYKNYVIHETANNVGRCSPLPYIYENGVDVICSQMVDPMNGFWLGIFLCSLLFLPTLFVAHKLQCLYKRIGPYVMPIKTNSCPECSGKPGPMQPRTVMVCSGGLGKKSCSCPSQLLSQKVSQSGDFPSSGNTVKAHHSPRRKSGGFTSEYGEFFDVEAQQTIVYHEPPQVLSKRKVD